MNIAVLADSASMSEAHVLRAALEKHDHQVCVLDIGGFEAGADQNPQESEVEAVRGSAISALQTKRPDICCIASGTKGDDGSLQDMLDLMRIAYVGSCSQACRLARDFQLGTFAMLRYAEASEEEVCAVPLAGYALSADLIGTEKEALAQVLEAQIPGGYPFEVILSGGSSCLGAEDTRSAGSDARIASEIKKARSLVVGDREELFAAFESCGKTGCSIRQWVEGLRLSVAVLGTGWDAYVLPPVVQEKEGAVLSYAPLRLEQLSSDERMAQAVRSEIERCAFEICLSLGLRDLALVELIWDGAQVRFVGVDALPHLAAGSPFALACEQAGLSVEGALDRLVSL